MFAVVPSTKRHRQWCVSLCCHTLHWLVIMIYCRQEVNLVFGPDVLCRGFVFLIGKQVGGDAADSRTRRYAYDQRVRSLYRLFVS